MLSREEQQALLEIARESIALALAGKGEIFPRRTPSGMLAHPAGAFVTIRLAGELRGCIGYVTSESPLARVVEEVAVKAAIEDPRFPRLTQSELAESLLEVSVLSSPERVDDLDEITVGLHGLIVERGNRRGLLLPQVATEQEWDRETFLSHTCRKAGLPPGAWKDPDTRVFLFRADVFREEEDAKMKERS